MRMSTRALLFASALAAGLAFQPQPRVGALPAALAESLPERVFPEGLGIGLVPPEGMQPSRRFPGFEDEARETAIMMMEMPPELFAKLEKDLRDPARDPDGFKLIKREAWPVDGGKGVLIEASQEIEGATVYKWVLVRGTPASAAFVTFQVSAGARDHYTEDVVRRTLRSLAVRDHAELQAEVDALPFTVDETLDDASSDDRTGFRVSRVIPGSSVMLTNGPKDLVQAAEQPVIVIGSGTAAIAGKLEQDRFARQSFAGLTGLRSVQVRRGEGVTREGVDWHEMEADAQDAESGAKVRIFQAIRFDRSAFIRFVIVARDDAYPQTLRFLDGLRDSVGLRADSAASR